MQDTVVRLANQGINPQWLMDLDLLSFNAFAESALRIESNKELEQAWLTALAFHDNKQLMKQVKKSRTKLGQATKTGDDLAAALGGG